MSINCIISQFFENSEQGLFDKKKSILSDKVFQENYLQKILLISTEFQRIYE